MQIDVLTLFPSMFSPLFESIIGKAREKGIISLNIHNIRDYSRDKHKSVDDAPYGGGAGMVLKAEPIFDAISSLKKQNKSSRVILMTPGGKKLDHEKAASLSKEKGLMIICGHYEDIDDRVREKLVDEEVSIGDYVLTGGEIPAMVLIDAVSRLIPGALGNEDSSKLDSFSDGLIEGPNYTRPEEFSGVKVPKVLLSGNHKEVRIWKRQKALEMTLFKRPELFAKAMLEEQDIKLMNKIVSGEQQ